MFYCSLTYSFFGQAMIYLVTCPIEPLLTDSQDKSNAMLAWDNSLFIEMQLSSTMT